MLFVKNLLLIFSSLAFVCWLYVAVVANITKMYTLDSTQNIICCLVK